jgi:hypothetical protein
MRLTISSAAALLLMASAAVAAEPVADPNCPSTDIVSAVLQRHYPDIHLTHIEGADARRFVDAFNSGSASDSWPADEVLIARNPRTPEKARIGFFKDGCLLALVPRSLWTIDSLQRSLKNDQDI